MHWIAVHEEVLGGKLRGFRKHINCSDAEALGILTVLWLWARRNADISGLLVNADRKDVADAIAQSLGSSLNAETVTDALIKEGWIDEIDGLLYVHDWYEWQQYWYNYLEKKEKDKLRKRIERERQKDIESKQDHQSESQKKSEDTVPEETNPKEEKPKKLPKNKYAESVSMYEAEYQKLVDKYGSEFTEKLVYVLNNYKLATGKSYKDDYRAILNWVVGRCEEEYPHLKKVSQETSSGENPFK